MSNEEMLRVVVVRKGRARQTEFRLRDGEIGLSLFRSVDHIPTPMILAAVRAAGKQGELAGAMIPRRVVRDLGLTLVSTPGGTADAAVNAVHVEARASWVRRIVLWLRGVPIHEWFNETIAPALAAAAQMVE